MRGHAPRSEGSKVAVISLHNGIHFVPIPGTRNGTTFLNRVLLKVARVQMSSNFFLARAEDNVTFRDDINSQNTFVVALIALVKSLKLGHHTLKVVLRIFSRTRARDQPMYPY